jgi:hypothetical protein
MYVGGSEGILVHIVRSGKIMRKNDGGESGLTAESTVKHRQERMERK